MLSSLHFNFVAIVGLAIAASSLLMAVVMLSLGKNLLNRIWGFFCVAVFIWGSSFFFIGSATNPEAAELWWRISHIGVIFIPILFIHFVYVFLKNPKYPWLRELYWLGVVLLAANFFSELFINGTRFAFNSFYYDTPGPLYLPFVLFFNGAIIYGHYLLLRAYLASKDSKKREQIRYFFMATFVGFLGGGISFGPVFGVDMYPYTIATVPLYPIVMGYAILKFGLFNLKVVTAQVTSLAIFVFMFVRFVLSNSPNDFILNGLFTVVAAGLGIFLVRSVTKEVEALEQVRLLAHNLEKANTRLTELDRQKSEFIGIAAHQLRTPIAAIKGYSSLILEGSYGALSTDLHGVVKTIFDSSDRMADTISDFLNVTRIEQGRMEYHKEKLNLRTVIESTIETFKLAASEKHLELLFTEDNCKDEDHIIVADPGKIQHVVNNLLDNAIKYTALGSVTIHLACPNEKGKIRVSVKDSGAGIPKDAIGGLFEKFVRARNAKNINVTGSGLGLFVARQMIEAHKGKIWAESDGEGKGATFIFEIPKADKAALSAVEHSTPSGNIAL